MAGLEPEFRPSGTPEGGAANEPAARPAGAAGPGGAPGQSAPAGDREAELTAAVEAAQAKANEYYDLYLRARAETDNARRRAQEEVGKAHKVAVEAFAEALVPVVDSLEKALQAQAPTVEGLHEGAEITLRQLRAAFDRNRLTEINPVGEKFDPHRHQAIAMVPVPADGSVAPNQVVSVLQKGWMIADRVLRPALVTVAQAS
ncbi:MAG TPA: nucleotide exchange factor GrpE [Burkholderiaceae bacterium]